MWPIRHNPFPPESPPIVTAWMERASITCFIMQIDIRTSENNAAFCTARLQIANETALPDKSLKPTLCCCCRQLSQRVAGGSRKEGSLCSERTNSPQPVCLLLSRSGRFLLSHSERLLSQSHGLIWTKFFLNSVCGVRVEETGSRWAPNIDTSYPKATLAL